MVVLLSLTSLLFDRELPLIHYSTTLQVLKVRRREDNLHVGLDYRQSRGGGVEI